MKPKFQLLIILLTLSFNSNAQSILKFDINIGDSVPALKVKAWIKGTPVKAIEKNKVYVIDFWATWCIPCMQLMPHFSKMAKKYQGKATFLSIDILEKQNISVDRIRRLVDTMGNRMDFTVGIEEGNLMTKSWANASKLEGIPRIFIINNGIIDWIGHPKYADSVLNQILNKSWKPELALIKRIDQFYLRDLELMAAPQLANRTTRYELNIANNTHERIRISADSILMVVNEMVNNVPNLKFLPAFIAFTFPALLQTDTNRAYNFAREAMATHTYYDEPPYLLLVQKIEQHADQNKLPESIYRLGADCCQAWIDLDPYPELGMTSNTYQRMANMYRLAGDFIKASEAEQKAEDFLPSHIQKYN